MINRRNIFAFVFVICFFGFANFIYGYGNHNYTDEKISAFTNTELNIVTARIPTTHPRIFLKASELEALRARVGIGSPSDYNFNTLKWRGKNIAFGEMASEYQTLRNLAVTYKNEPEGMWVKVDGNKKIKLISWTAAAYAFVNLLEPDPAYITSAKYMLDKTLANPQLRHDSDGGEQTWAFAIAYDWLAKYLTPSEQEPYITYMLDQVEIFGFVGRSNGTFPKLFDLSNLNPATGLRGLFIGFALYNDLIGTQELNENNKEAKKIIKDYGGFFKRVVDGFKMVGGSIGGWQEDFGHSYMALDNMLPLVEMWYQATGEDLYANFNTIHYRPLLNYQMAKPSGAALFSNFVPYNNYRSKAEYELIANRYNDSIIESMAEQDFKLLSDGYLWKEILWKDTGLSSTVNLNTTLPKVYKFEPTGWTFIRSGWDMGTITNPSNEFWSSLFSGRYFASHRYYVMNSFGMFFKGDLFVNKSNSYTTAKYSNTIMLDDDNQVFTSGPRSGPSDIVGWKNYEAGTKADLSRFTKFETTDTYTYSHSESHEIYDTAKLDYWTREFVYLNPAQDKYYFLTYDRMTTDLASTAKKNMLNIYNQPQINGDIIQADVGGSSTANMDGRAFVKVLMPENHNISTEQIPGNETIDQKKAKPRWCMYITPAIQSREDKFLNVIQATDSSTSSMTPTTLITADTMKGTLINDSTTPQVVLFSSDSQGKDVTSVTYHANYASSASGKHLLLGMSPGMYDIYKNGNMILSDVTASSQGVLSFSSTGGSTFQVVRTGSTLPHSGTNPPLPPTGLTAKS